MTFQGCVYDVTKFAGSHPGGNKILLAAGKSLEPFWSMYRVHDSNETRALLEQYQIGHLPQSEKDMEPDMSDQFATEPDRSWKHVKINTMQPFNAETPPDKLIETDITPTSSFFVRNHLPVPKVDPDLYELEVSGIGLETRVFTLKELKALPKRTIRATIQCSGLGLPIFIDYNFQQQSPIINERSDSNQRLDLGTWRYFNGGMVIYDQTYRVSYPMYRRTGALLVDVLKICQDKSDPEVRHVVFDGLDRDMEQNYGASIPIETASNPNAEVLLVTGLVLFYD